jgi:quercetin dioxygenase-like cupin family protein
MSKPAAIERRPLLAADLTKWTTTKVDVRSIRFAPGQATGVHSHPCHVIGYIAEGTAIRSTSSRPPTC